MIERETSHEIDAAAALWAARLDRETLSPADESLLDNWLKADPRHLGAFMKARAICARTERARALGLQFDPARFSKERAAAPPSRRYVAMGAAAAVLAVAVVGGRKIATRTGDQTFSTQLGETRIIPLQDGSVLTLNTASSIEVAYTKERRDVRLLKGEVLFDVAKDPKRPFVVTANDTQIRAVGTSFTVQVLSEQPVRVLVREGVVELKRVGVPTAPIVRVGANTRAVAPVNAPIAARAVKPTDVERELTWRVGRIAFEGQTLRQAAAAFERYSDTRIVIADSSIADETIVGLFVSNDPVGFAKAVAISLNLRVDVGNGQVRLSR